MSPTIEKREMKNASMSNHRKNNSALQPAPKLKWVSFRANDSCISKGLTIPAKEAPQLIRNLFIGFIILFPFLVFVLLLRIQPDREAATKTKKVHEGSRSHAKKRTGRDELAVENSQVVLKHNKTEACSAFGLAEHTANK